MLLKVFEIWLIYLLDKIALTELQNHNNINKTAVEMSSESEPEDPADLTELEEIKVDDEDL